MQRRDTGNWYCGVLCQLGDIGLPQAVPSAVLHSPAITAARKKRKVEEKKEAVDMSGEPCTPFPPSLTFGDVREPLVGVKNAANVQLCKMLQEIIK